MLHIEEAIIVEGKYDKMLVERVCDAPVFTTEGFRIFNDKEKRGFLSYLAQKHGIIVLTDSDRAGFMIRNHIKGLIKSGTVKHAYIPEIYGKEKRKISPSKEGKLGVEGMMPELLEKVLSTYSKENTIKTKITKTDLFDAGLYGGTGSAASRLSLCEKLSVPSGISTNALVDALNALMTREEFLEFTGK